MVSYDDLISPVVVLESYAWHPCACRTSESRKVIGDANIGHKPLIRDSTIPKMATIIDRIFWAVGWSVKDKIAVAVPMNAVPKVHTKDNFVDRFNRQILLACERRIKTHQCTPICETPLSCSQVLRFDQDMEERVVQALVGRAAELTLEIVIRKVCEHVER
jgi:hypothetical protein